MLTTLGAIDGQAAMSAGHSLSGCRAAVSVTARLDAGDPRGADTADEGLPADQPRAARLNTTVGLAARYANAWPAAGRRAAARGSAPREDGIDRAAHFTFSGYAGAAREGTTYSSAGRRRRRPCEPASTPVILQAGPRGRHILLVGPGARSTVWVQAVREFGRTMKALPLVAAIARHRQQAIHIGQI
jgi:hypothetical protein